MIMRNDQSWKELHTNISFFHSFFEIITNIFPSILYRSPWYVIGWHVTSMTSFSRGFTTSQPSKLSLVFGLPSWPPISVAPTLTVCRIRIDHPIVTSQIQLYCSATPTCDARVINVMSMKNLCDHILHSNDYGLFQVAHTQLYTLKQCKDITSCFFNTHDILGSI